MSTAARQPNDIFALRAPSPALWTLYLIRALLTGPGLIFLLPYLFFRYHTLRYTFDEEGIHMRVGILFRREINLTYARIQDIHLRSGLLQRWLGLADIQIQTASGSADAELVIEGFKQYEAIRDFLYTRMRGYHAPDKITPALVPATGTEAGRGDPNAEMISLLLSIRDELRQAREALQEQKETLPPDSSGQAPSSADHV
ncbi:MAG TPA: PH domain-containing protein [Chthoniobacterales bacterium]|jgi:putative membrane protein|nr:PH domain-containing protein [Chthoniobacterales bacterium]